MAADAGLYSCEVSGDCGVPAVSTQATLTVNDPIVITTQPSPTTACIGTNTSLNVVASPASGLTYQWHFDADGAPVAFVDVGMNSPALPVNGVVAGNAGTYYCSISNACGQVATTNQVIFTVPVSTSITTHPAGTTVCEGTTVNLAVTAAGTALTYQWFKDANPVPLSDDVVIKNSNSATLTLSAVTPAYSGNYRVKVTGTCYDETSAPDAEVVVKQKVAISSQPVSITRCSGSDASFSVVATGDISGYQWQFDAAGAPVAFVNVGTNAPDYTIVAPTALDAGNYRCVISTTNCGSVNSSQATLSINPLTIITAHPAAVKNVCVGSNVSFSVTASGIGLTYQWYKNLVSMGALYTSSTLNLSNVAAGDAASYTCRVNGNCGPEQTSTPGVLNVDIPVAISTHPLSGSVCVNASHDINVILSQGTNPVYQWYFDNGTGFIAVPGGSAQVLDLSPFTAAKAGKYYCVVTNGCGSATSQTATLTLIDAFTITSGIANASVCENGSKTYTIAADQPVSFRWMKNGVDIPGATNASLILNNIPFADNGSVYSCEVYNNCKSQIVTSTLTVSTPLSVTTQPQNGTACPGAPYSINIVTSGSNPQYQWYKAPAALLAGQTASSLSFAAFAAGDVGTYYCIVTNGCGSITSNNAAIAIGTATSITVDPLPLTYCTGNDATFTVTAAGTNLTYSWRKNYIPLVDDGRIIGSHSGTLTINDIVAGDEETYDVIVTGTCGLPATSAGAFLDVRSPPTFTDQPDPVTICSGQNATFRVVVPVIPSDPSPTYQWQLNSVAINPVANPSAATPTLNIVGALTGGIYNCVVTKASCGSITSTSAELIIEQNISITGQPAASQTKCQGSNVSFSATLTGPTDMTLQWYKDDGTPAGVAVVNGPRISGATLPTLSINNIAASDAGSYFLRATGSCGTSVTNSAALIVQGRITITQQPKSTTVCPAGTLNLSVIASGTVTDYTWKRNGVVVGSGSTYSVGPFVAATHAGDYTVELTNICETVVSDIAIVTAGVATSASISADLTKCEGENASFTVTATGSNLTYQWYKGSTLLADNARIGGSNMATLTISGLIPSDGATYQCDVSGSCNSDNDNAALLTVNQNVAITIQPSSTSALIGTNPTFTVVATGNITGYQWYKGATLLNDPAFYSGFNTPNLTVLDAQAADEGSYSCVVSGTCIDRTSSTATLTVIPASGIVTQPVTPVAVCETSNFSINIVATAGAHTYQWRRDGTPLSDDVRISGSGTSVLSVTGVDAGDAGAYTCLLDGSEISAASVVSVKPTTNITAHPSGGTKCVGDMHILSVTATGANLTYQWYKNDLGSAVAGATFNEYTINPLAVGDNGIYFCVVTGDCGQKTSNPAALTVNIPISVIAQPVSPAPLCEGNSTSLFFNISGTNLTYLWNKNGSPITDANITGINTNTLVITNSVVSNTGSYTCTVSGLCSSPVTSNAASVTVNPVTVITTQPISRVKCENEAVTFTVAASGMNLHYSWRLNGVAIGAPDNPVYSIPVLVKGTHEGNYTCVISGDCGPDVTSNIATLTVYRNTSVGIPVITATPVCQNGNTNISVTATGDNLTYLWKKDGLAITSGNVTGITNNTLVISNAAVTDGGVYTCTVTGACGSPQTSVNATVTVNPTTVITSQPSNYVKCAGDEVIFTVAATGAGLTYQWKIGGAAGANVSDGLQASGATISGATTNQMKISGTTISEAGSYACVITGTCGSVNSDPASLTVNIPVAISIQPPALTPVCQGASTEINVTSSGTAVQYRWKKGTSYLVNGGSISGVNTSKLVISNALSTDAGFYSCEISNSCNTVNTQIAELRVNPLPAFTVNPAGATLCSGENIQLMVTATGAVPVSYQWQFNAIDIPGANSSTLTLNGLITSNSGAYTCIITPASCGSATSTPAVLTVNPAVDISIHPATTSVCQGTTAIFSVTATGTAPLTYQWKYNNTPISNGGRISGATSNELRISLAAEADEGIYKCDIASGCGSETSGSAILSVDPATAITVQPLSQTIVAGTDAIFSISAAGIITNYQWQMNGSPIIDGMKYSGSGTPILTVKSVAISDEASYRCVVTSNCGTVNSNLGVLKVVVPVTISASTGDQTKCTTESASFSVVAAGTINTYQWIFNGTNIVDGGAISGAQTPNLVISSVTSGHEGNYACVVTGTYNVAISDVATLTVNDPPVITIHPVTQTLCVHDWLVLEVTATGDGLSYEWEKNGSTVTADPRITGINNSLLVITDIDPSFSGIYRCRVWNGCQTRWSNDAVITINPSMALLTNPSPSEIKCEGQTVTFSVTTSGVNVLYQWYKGGVAITNTTRITGAQTKNLTITGIVAGDADSYSCVVTDNCNSINSTTGVLTVRENVVISSQPSNQTVCEGQNAFFNVAASGYNLVYTWQKNGAPITDANISGINTSTLVITNATTANAGVYRCFLDGGCNDILTGTANLTVNALPAAPGAVTGAVTLCQGAKGVLYTVPVIANATSYVWSLPYNATIVSGAGTRSITVDYLAGSLSGSVSVHGVNGCADGPESAVLPVTVNAVPEAVAGPDQVLCTDATAFAASAPAFGTPTWNKLSGQGIIGASNSPTSPLTGIGQGENVFMWSVTSAGCTSRDTVKIYNRRVYVDAGIDQIVCSFTSTVNANVPSIGTGSWSIITGGGSFSDMTNPKASVINLARGTNTLRWSINNGGCISYDEMIIRNDLPTNSDAGRDTILIVDNYQLAAINPVIGTGQWTLQSGSATVTNPNLYNTTVTGLGIGDNVFRWTVTNNLCYSIDEVKVVNYTPTNTDAGPSQTLCVDYTTMAGTKPNYGTGQWTVVAGSATFKDPFKFDTEVINIGKGSNVYRWTIYEYKVTFDDVTIVNNSPSNANAGIDQRLCTDNAILSANQPVIGTGAWSVIGGSGTITDASKYNSTIGNLGPGSNTFRWTITSGACQSFDEVIVTNDQPTFAEAGGDQIICADSVNLYPNTPTIGIGEWSVVKGSAFFKGNKAYNLSRGDNELRWLISNNGCFDADTVLITSNKPTTSYTGEDKSICVDSIFLPGNAPTYGTGHWTMLSGAGVILDETNANSRVTNLASGQNRFRWTITYNNCVSFSEVDINYNFIQSNAGDDQILCGERASLNANDAGIGIGQWSVVGGSGSANFVNPTQSNTDVINLDKGTNTLRWTITNSGCVSYDNVVITNNMPTTAYAGSDRSVCGEEIFLNANAAVIGSGEWSVLSGAATIENVNLATTKVSNLSVGRNVLRWIISNQNCISFDEVVINNDQPSNIEAGPSQYICADTAQLYATAPSSGYGRWSILKGSATFQDNTLYNTKVFNLEKGENKLVWTVTSAGCSNYDSVTIANNLPSTPSAGPDQDICADNVFMAANTPSIGAGHWSIVSGSAVFENIAAPNSKVTGLGNGPNVLRWLLQSGSCILFDEVTITNSLPTVAYAGEDRAVCNTAATLLANAPVSGKGSWSVVSGYGLFDNASRHDAQIINLGFGPNTLRWTTENGRCRTSDDVIITNNLAEVYAGPDQVVYSPTIRLVGNKPAGGTGEWIVLAGQGTIQNQNSIETSVTGLGGGANTFSWTINNDGCIASDDVVITHRVLPIVSFEPLPAGGCPPLNITFVNTSIGGTPFTWDFGDGSTTIATNTDHTYYTPGKYNVRLTATGPDGIMVHRDSVIIIREIPVAQAEITPDIAYIPGNSVNFFNLSNNIDSLLWEFGDGNTSTEENPTHRYEIPGAYDVTLHVWSGYQCYDSLMLRPGVIVEKSGIINCPNAFTPNLNGPTGGAFNQNDFSNDVFHCYVDGVTDYHLEIYNRLGIRLFSSDDVNVGWDGYFKGKLVEEGAYVFKVYGRYNNGQQFNFVGNIVVLH